MKGGDGIKIAIIDSDEIFSRQLRRWVWEWFLQIGISQIEIDNFENGADFFSVQHLGEEYSLIFMDTVLNDMDGIDLAKRIRKYDEAVPVIFISTTNSHAMESYDVNACYFIQKPLTDTEFYGMMKAVLRKINTIGWIVSIDKDYYCSIKDICYVKQKGNTCTFYLMNDRSHVVYGKPEVRCTWLNAYPFFYQATPEIVINLHQVKKVENNAIILKNGHDVHMTKKAMKLFVNVYNRFVLQKMS